MKINIKDLFEYLRRPLGEVVSAVGIDIGTRYIKIAQVKKKGASYVLEKYGVQELLPDVIVDREVMDREALIENIKYLIAGSGIETKRVDTFIAGKNVILKKIEAKSVKRKKDFNKLLENLARENIPFDLKEVVIDYKKLSEKAGKMELLLIGAKSEFVYPLVDILKEAGVPPYSIDIPPFILKTVYEKNNYIEKEGGFLIINIGFEHTFVSGILDGKYLFDDEIPFGVRSFREEIQRICNLSAKDAELLLAGKEIETPAEGGTPDIGKPIENATKRLINRIERVLPPQVPEWKKIIIGGGGSHIAGLASSLATQFKTQCEIGNPLRALECTTTPPEVPEIFDLSIGLVISQLEKTNANLLPIEERVLEKSRWLSFVTIWYPIYIPFIILLFCGIIALNLLDVKNRIKADIVSMRKEQIELAPRVEEVKALVRRESELSEKVKAIKKLSSPKYTRVRLLDELNRLIPDYTWLTELNEISKDSSGVSLLIHGVTTSNFAVSDFMRNLQGSPYFDNIDLSYTQRKEIGDNETTEFEMKMRFKTKLAAAAPDTTNKQPSKSEADSSSNKQNTPPPKPAVPTK